MEGNVCFAQRNLDSVAREILGHCAHCSLHYGHDSRWEETGSKWQIFVRGLTVRSFGGKHVVCGEISSVGETLFAGEKTSGRVDRAETACRLDDASSEVALGVIQLEEGDCVAQSPVSVRVTAVFASGVLETVGCVCYFPTLRFEVLDKSPAIVCSWGNYEMVRSFSVRASLVPVDNDCCHNNDRHHRTEAARGCSRRREDTEGQTGDVPQRHDRSGDPFASCLTRRLG